MSDGFWKERLKDLTSDELDQLIVQAKLLQKLREPETAAEIEKISADDDPKHWLSVDEIESRLRSA